MCFIIDYNHGVNFDVFVNSTPFTNLPIVSPSSTLYESSEGTFDGYTAGIKAIPIGKKSPVC